MNAFSRAIEQANALKTKGDEFQNQIQSEEALKCYERAVTIYKKVGEESIGWADTLSNIGIVYKNQEKLK